MKKILLLIPPNKKGFIRDVYYGCWHEKKFIDYSWPPIGLYQLRSILGKNFKTLVVDGSILNEQQTISEIKNFSPNMVILNIGTFTFKDDLIFLRKIKHNLKTKTIVCGEFATTSPKKCLNEDCIDYAIKGEPEGAILNLVENIENTEFLKNIDGVCFKDYINKNSSFVENLDIIPFPKRNISEAKNYKNPLAIENPFTTVLATRGCPHSCTFCTVPVLYGKTFRKRSVKNILDELKILRNDGFKEIFFRDENLTLDKEFIKKLCDEIIKNKLKFSWICNSRIDTVDEKTLKFMKNAGCHLIKFGVESGNQEILNKIKKGITLNKIEEIFFICRKIGIDTLAHFMLGCPGETKRTIKRSIEFAKKLDPLYASFDIVLKYPNTELSCLPKHYLSESELKKWHDKAFTYYYLRPKLIIRHILKVKSPRQFLQKSHETFILWSSFIKNSFNTTF